MKFLVAIALIAAVASAGVIKPTQLSGELAEIQQIVAAINSPSTDPATAAALEAMLLDVMGVTPVQVVEVAQPSPIAVGPAIVEASPIAVGPAFVDFPLPDGGVVTAEEPTLTPVAVVAPSPAVVAPVTSENTPLVQIILNINQQAGTVESVVGPSPVVAPEAVQEVIVPGPVNIVDGADVIIPAPVVVDGVIVPGPVNIVDGADVIVPAPVVVDEVYQPGPVNVVDHIVVEPVQVVSPVVVEPVQVVAPIVVEPVIVGTPIIPAPAVVLPETLN
ncbi:putative cuticle protein CPH38 [Operophtera brumata]|uniref:Putative cuticle protein CPH38 n=1 Tax=Operophtera brumata TaxID=104452 RepID=A0A0L7KRF3_OPEBR|nr:putative cuticle protein CPH38 [Operophtera brumata]